MTFDVSSGYSILSTQPVKPALHGVLYFFVDEEAKFTCPSLVREQTGKLRLA